MVAKQLNPTSCCTEKWFWYQWEETNCCRCRQVTIWGCRLGPWGEISGLQPLLDFHLPPYTWSRSSAEQGQLENQQASSSPRGPGVPTSAAHWSYSLQLENIFLCSVFSVERRSPSWSKHDLASGSLGPRLVFRIQTAGNLEAEDVDGGLPHFIC